MAFSPEMHERFIEQTRWTEEARRVFFQSTRIKPDGKILETGCGTGAFLTSLRVHHPGTIFGIDNQFDLLAFAGSSNKTSPISCADVNSLPFREGCFDAVLCHFFLLWVTEPVQALAEMIRVVRSGGAIAALAEPDYGSRIEYPQEFETIGNLQRDSLIRQGAQPDTGRRLPELLSQAGCHDISYGILGSFSTTQQESRHIRSEHQVLKDDLFGLIDTIQLSDLLEKDQTTRSSGTRVQFIPTFFAWGFKS